MKKRTKPSLNTMKRRSILSWIGICSLLLIGCQGTKIVVIPEDQYVHWIAPGVTVTATNGFWAVPDARMQQILRKLNEP